MHDSNIKHATSTFDTDPFEPQPDGVRTLLSFRVQYNSSDGGYAELPYALPQDFTLFTLFKEKSIQIWKEKIDWVAEKVGMALLNSHLDYMNCNKKIKSYDKYPAKYYENFLKYIRRRFKEEYRQVLRYYKEYGAK